MNLTYRETPQTFLKNIIFLKLYRDVVVYEVMLYPVLILKKLTTLYLSFSLFEIIK